MDDKHAALLPYRAVLFDLDGVLTSTARLHAGCWKSMFDDFLRRRAEQTGQPFTAFDAQREYEAYVDGKPRYEGVRGFLEARGIQLPYGSPADTPTTETICGLGNRKDQLVKEAIAAGQVEAFAGSVALVHALHGRKVPLAVVSSSRNCRPVLKAAALTGFFAVCVDGDVAAELKLRGKPEPDTYLHAAELLGVAPAHAVVVEDAIVGVAAGRAGGFGLVVGVDRGQVSAALRQHGADLIVTDLAELIPP